MIRQIHLTTKKAAVILLLVCAVTYAPGLKNDFNIDASIYLSGERADLFKTFSDYFTVTKTRHYSPFNNLLNINLFEFFGNRSTVPYRLVSLVFFYLNGFCMFYFLSRLSRNEHLALIIAVLYCVHPINAELLNHITLNIVFLMSAFLYLAMIFFDLYAQGQKPRRNYFFSLLFFCLALLSHGLAVLFPLYLWAFVYFARKETFLRSIKHCLAHACVAGIFVLLWSRMAAPQAELSGRITDLNLSLASYAATLFHLLVWYVGNLFVPLNIVFIYNLSPLTEQALFGNILLAALAVCLITLFLLWRKNLKSFALFWFLSGFLIILPAGLAHSYMGLVIEPYWLFFSSAGFFLLLGLVLRDVGEALGKKWFYIAAGTLVAYFFVAAQVYVAIGRTELARSTHWVRTTPDNPVALMDFAQAHSNKKEYDTALAYFQKAIAASRDDTANKAYFNIGVILAERGQDAKAKPYLRKSISINPNLPHPYNTLGTIAVKQKDHARAEELFRKALSVNSRFHRARSNLAELYVLEGRYHEAIEQYETILSFDPAYREHPKVLSTLSALYLKMGDTASSTRAMEGLIRRDNRPEHFLALGYAFETLGFRSVAVTVMEQALSLYPDNIDVLDFYGTLLANSGKLNKAVGYWQRGLKIEPGNERLRSNIDEARKFLGDPGGF